MIIICSQVSVKDAKKTVDLWYRERKEVLRWQEKRKQEAHTDNKVHTLLGRARCFPSLACATPSQRGHIERAAINTPVQVLPFFLNASKCSALSVFVCICVCSDLGCCNREVLLMLPCVPC